MKKLFLILLAAVSAFTAQAQNKTITASLAMDTPAAVLTGGKYEILGVLFQNADATNTVLKFYDAATATTNYIRGAYTAYVSYATNYSTTFTNTAGIVITNTFSGTYRGTSAVTTNSAVERPKIIGPLAAPASAVLTVDDIAVSPNLGLVALSSASRGTLQITYRETNP